MRRRARNKRDKESRINPQEGKKSAAIEANSRIEKQHDSTRKRSGLSESQRLPNPASSDDEQFRAEKRYWKQQVCAQWATVVVTFLAFLAAVVYAWYAHQQVNTMDDTLTETRNANTRLTDQFKASERPYVSFGSRDGDLIQIREGSDGEPFLALYFYNAGKTPARRFLVNAFSNARIPIVRHDRHLARFAESNPADPTFSGLVIVRGDGDIAAESTFIHYLDKQYSPDKKEWEGLRHGQTILEGNPGHLEAYPFQVFGTFEYCDVFGGYHCDSFAANYSAPLNTFTRAIWTSCVPGEPSAQDFADREFEASETFRISHGGLKGREVHAEYLAKQFNFNPSFKYMSLPRCEPTQEGPLKTSE